MPKINFAVPFPEAGEHAILTYEFSDLKALQEALGDEYVRDIYRGLDASRIPVIETCMRIGIKGGDFEAAMRNVAVSELTGRIGDALMLRLRGKTVAEMDPA